MYSRQKTDCIRSMFIMGLKIFVSELELSVARIARQTLAKRDRYVIYSESL